MSKKKKKNKIPFYTKIINVENVAKLETLNKKGNCMMRAIFFISTVQAAGLINTFTGFSLQHFLSELLFYLEMALIAISFLLLTIQYFVMRKNKIFKKERYFWLLHLPNYLIALGIFISSYLNTTYVPRDDGGYEIHFNPVFYFLIFIPLIILYVWFFSIAYLKCLQTNVRIALIENKVHEYSEKIEKTSLRIEQGTEESITKEYIDEESKEE